MSHSSWAALAVAAPSLSERPAGAAPFDQVLIATGAAGLLSALLAVLVLGHRTGRLAWLERAARRAERSRWSAGAAGWATLPLLVAAVSLVTALLGMYWDIALHIGVGRDEGPLANPAHYPIMFGLYGISTAGVLACALPRGEEAGPAAVRLAPGWRAPVGGLLIAGAGSYALLGFPLDDVWHRLFGQDVTLWGPTHLMLLGGAGLSLVGMTVLLAEGSAGRPPAPGTGRYIQRSFLMGGLLIGLSVFQAEYDFGVPQFRLVLQPLMIAAAAGLALVAARLWVGRGGAVAAVGFYLLVRGGVSVLVGPVLGELWSSVPLYVVEAVCIEAAALRLAHRPLALGGVGGVLVGTVGFAAEHAWTQIAFPLPWTGDVVAEGLAMAVVGGVAGGVLGALLVMALENRLPVRRTATVLFSGCLATLATGVTNGLVASTPQDLGGRLTVDEAEGAGAYRTARVIVTFDRPAVDGAPAWVTMTGWQGVAGGAPAGHGLYVEPMTRVDDRTYRSAAGVPLAGSWKTMVRLHDGRTLAALPVYLPRDEAIDEDRVPATDGAHRLLADEKLVLQRELDDDVPGWLWLVAGLVVLACSITLAVALGWGVQRFARAVPEASREKIGHASWGVPTSPR